jgi:octaprenyl-diphosphate synthase
LASQGKQLRPALVALSARAAGGREDDLVKVAAIIEMVHLATLVHDDIMDAASVRRRRPTLAARWGNSVSVLLGDCLFAHAVKMAAGFRTPDICRAVADATKTVCSGEILQTQYQGNFQLDREEYLRVLRMKTAELFALSCQLGASLSGAAEASCTALREYGLALGTAYQLYDDCLDLFGSEATAGKSLGTDLIGGKATLPVIIALERSDPAEREALIAVLSQWKARMLPGLLELLERHGASAECGRVIRDFCQDACRRVGALPPNQGTRTLTGVADYLVQQAGVLGVRSLSSNA